MNPQLAPPILFGAALEFIDRFSNRMPLWASQWLTGFWVIGLGFLIGLVLLAALLAIGVAISKIPGVGDLATDNKKGRIVWLALSALIFAPLMWYGYGQIQGGLAGRPGGEQITQVVILGAYAAGFALFAGLAVLALTSNRTVAELGLIAGEGVAPFYLGFAALFALWGVLGISAAQQPRPMIESILRWPRNSGSYTLERTVAVPSVDQFVDPPAVEVDLNLPNGFRPSRTEVVGLAIGSSESLQISAVPFADSQPTNRVDVAGQSEGESKPTFWPIARSIVNPFETETVDKVYVKNMGDKPAMVKVDVIVSPVAEQMLVVPVVAAGFVMIALLYLVHRAVTPKLAAVALATAKSEMSTVVFIVLLLVGVVSLIFFEFTPYYTMGEDVKMLKDNGLIAMLVLCLAQAVWSASGSVADEIEGKTALTVLSKPVGRRDFVLGKFVGIVWLVAAMMLVFTVVFLLCVAYKPIYDSREGGSAKLEVTWQDCFFAIVGVAPGLGLVFMETVIFAALSVALSTRLPMLANLSICLAVFALGHLTPLLIQSTAIGLPEPVIFTARLIGTILPVLDYFSISAAIASDKLVPLTYVFTAFAYCFIYSAVCMLLALVLFEDRDLA